MNNESHIATLIQQWLILQIPVAILIIIAGRTAKRIMLLGQHIRHPLVNNPVERVLKQINITGRQLKRTTGKYIEYVLPNNLGTLGERYVEIPFRCAQNPEAWVKHNIAFRQ